MKPPAAARPRLGITVQLFFVAILPLTILLLVITFGTLSLHHAGMRSLVGERSLASVRAAAASLHRELIHQSDRVALAASLASEEDPQALQNIISSSFDGGAAFFSSSGELLTAGHPAEAWAGWLASERSFLLTDLWENSEFGPAFTPAADVPGQGSLVFVASRTESGRLLVAAFSPQSAGRQVLQEVSDQAGVTLIDRQNRVLYQDSSLPTDDPRVTGQVIAMALQGSAGIEYSNAPDGERVVAYSPVPPLGWVLLVEEPWESIANPLLEITEYSPLVLIPILILALVALWFALNQIVRPLQALEERAVDLAEGDFEAIREPVGGISEIRHLQSVLAETAGQLQATQDELHHYIGALTAGVEQERLNLARELHDDTLQTMVALSQRLQLAALQQDPQENGQLSEAIDLTRDAALNLRRVVQGLRPIYLEDLGMAAALGMLARQNSRNGAPQVEFRLTGEERRLAPEVELAFYRIAQEALSNALHHAAANLIIITLDYSQGVRLKVQDDGIGFDVPARSGEYASRGHYGLLGMAERADLINADLGIQSSPGKGTVVSVFRPD